MSVRDEGGACERCGTGGKLWLLDGEWLCDDCCLDIEGQRDADEDAEGDYR